MSSATAPGLLVLLSLLSAVRGDCPPPPKVKNAGFRYGDPGTHFPDGKKIVYECLPNFENIYGKLDIIQCVGTSWTNIDDFCEQICPNILRFRFAEPRENDIRAHFVPGNTVTYDCRTAYEMIPGINSLITCLQNYTWTKLPMFCKRKSCGDPGNPENGKTIIQTDLLYLSRVNFICDKGYGLNGSSSAQCRLNGSEVKWNQELPNCKRITCVSPPDISNGTHTGSNGTFAYNSTITYKCDDGFLLIGEASLSCITENQINGVWNGSVPECRRNHPQDSTVATTTVTTPMLFTGREMERRGTSSGDNYNSTPISRTGKKGSQIGIMAGVSAVSLVVAFLAVAAIVKASRRIRQKRTSSYNLNQGSKRMQLSETSQAML